MNHENDKPKIKNFTDLNCWKLGKDLAVESYKFTSNFPKNEIYGITNQIRRSSVSISANIAEGFSRNTYKDKIQFYCIAQGSLTELQSHLHISREIGYLSQEDFQILYAKTIVVNKLLNGLIRTSRTKL